MTFRLAWRRAIARPHRGFIIWSKLPDGSMTDALILGQDDGVLPAEALFYFLSTKRGMSSVDVRR